MQLTNHRSSASEDTRISFPMLECWNAITKVATVAAEANKRRVLCRISLESLRDKFGASEEEPMRSVARHRTAIQEAARKLIENEIYEEDSSVLIHARDL
jgi:hypothetical protein